LKISPGPSGRKGVEKEEVRLTGVYAAKKRQWMRNVGVGGISAGSGLR
jgi:hypothetical protein